jgi:sec-independent protein translocase protein TatA
MALVLDALTPWHLLLILVAFVLLVGYKKLPDATRSLGRSLRIFKSEVGALHEDDAAPAPAPAPAALPAAAGAAGTTAEELEAQARAEEARAAELRARLAGGPAA